MVTSSRKRPLWIAIALIAGLVVGCAAPAAAPAPTSAPAATTSAAAAPATTQPVATTAAPATSAAPATTSVAAVPTGELRIGVAELGAEAVDPILMSITGSSQLALIYDYLVGITYDGKLSKDTGLATDWQVSPDGLVWTFKIRKGAKFQNGDEVTAEDVKFSIERAMSDKSRLGNVGVTRKVIGPMTVPDPYTLVINAKVGYATLPYFLSQSLGSHEGAVVPKKYTTEVGDEKFAGKPIGSGPYKVVDVKPGSKLVLEAVPNHWRVGVPKYKTITFSIIGEPTTLIASLKRNENDIIGVPVSFVKEVAGYNLAQKKDGIVPGLYINQQWDDVPYKDVRVRQAMAEAIDRKGINDALAGGLGTPASIGPIGGSWALGWPNPAPIPYSPDNAKKLLADAGYPQGFEITFYSMPRPGGYDLAKMAEMIAEYWRAVGISAKIVKTDYTTFRGQWMAKKAPNSVYLNSPPNFSLWDATTQTTFHSKGAATTAMDPKLDALIDAWQASKTLDDYAKGQGATIQYIRDNYREIGIIEGPEFFATLPALKGWNPGKVTTFHDYDSLIRSK